ncbi:hypothetical protein H2200_010439 [Cladophialophora chaetospira]|uniref:Uncharacterized protein n=1 Tax=Cladophialophora chaetospira TaxID=386627 RepID=A0AA38X1H4_9EURO|nr:hypothetical protein H2200_010439 [Cladophialophora chaetospira]
MRPSLMLTPLALLLSTTHAQFDSLISDINSLASSVVSAVGTDTTNAALLSSVESDIASAASSLTTNSQYSSLVEGFSSQLNSVTGSLGSAAASATASAAGATQTGSSGDSGNAGERVVPGAMVALGAVVGVAVLM